MVPLAFTGLLPDRTSLRADLLAHFPVIAIEVHADSLFKALNGFNVLFSLFYYFLRQNNLAANLIAHNVF